MINIKTERNDYMKKIIAVLAVMLVCWVPVHAEDDILPLLNGLNIMTGDENGDYHLDNLVTRAEFTKIAVAASSHKDTVALSLKVSPFSDVKYTDWFAPYVKAAVTGGLVEGYIDGSFRPNNNVSYEEAVTMLLRALGYTDEDFGDSWPYGQIGMANSLEMTANVGASLGEAITRRQAAQLVYNTLDSKQKGSNNKLLSVFDCEIIEGATIIASSNEDSSLGSDKIYTTKGILEVTTSFNPDYIGRQGDLIVKNGDDFLAFTPNEQAVEDYSVSSVIGNDLIVSGQILDINENTTAYYKSQSLTYQNLAEKAAAGDTLRLVKNKNGSVDYVLLINSSVNGGYDTLDKYVIYSVLNNAVIGYKNGSFIQIDIKDSTTCYKETTKSTYASVRNDMEMGDILYVRMNGSVVDYVNYEKGVMEGPVMVLSADWQNQFGTDASTKVMRDGTSVSASAIQTNDIVYFCAELNMILAYSDKVTGIYEDATPTKDAPTTVKISGKEYGIESVSAFNALSSSGSAKIGDTITVALGRNGDIAGVVSGSMTTTKIGYLTEAGKKTMTDTNGNSYTGYYAVVVGADGVSSEYEVSRDYSEISGYVGAVVKASFKDGSTSITKVNTTGGVSGTVDSDEYKIGSVSVSANAKILDTVVSDSYAYTMYKRIYLQRLDGMSIEASKVLYYETNSAGEISELILKDVTGDAYSYGIVTSSQTSGENRSYTIDIKGKAYTKSNVSLAHRAPVRAYMGGGSLISVSALQSYSGSVSEISSASCTINNTEYLLSDDVVVYYMDGEYNPRMITLDEAVKNGYTGTAYYDKTQEYGGRIRVLVVK